MLTKEELKGHGAILFANMLWGGMSPVTKYVLKNGDLTGLQLSAIRIIGATIIFVVIGALLPNDVAPREKIQRGDWWRLIAASLLIITFNQALYVVGIGYTSPIDSSVMSTLTPLFTMLCAAIFIKMPITWLKATGVAMGLAGALLMVLGQGSGDTETSNPVVGDSLCLVAQFCAALYYVLFRDIITRYSPFTLMKWMFIISSCTFGVFMLPELAKVNFSAITGDVWGSICYIIVFATFISYLTIPYAQQRIKPTAVAMYTYFQPVTAALLAAILGLATFGFVKIAATALIFAGVWFVTRSQTAPSRLKN